MKKLLIIPTLFLMSLSLMGHERTEKTGLTILESNFKSFSMEKESLTFITKGIGMKFLLKLDDSAPRVLEYNEKKILPSKFKKALFVGRGNSFSIENKGDGKFLISEMIDRRFSAGKHKTVKFLLKMKNGKLVASE
jgi:hypothetical protein